MKAKNPQFMTRWMLVLSLVVCFLTLVPTELQAQTTKVRFGIKGGFNVNEFSFSDDVFKKDNKAGFFVGPTLSFGLPVFGLGADISGLYNIKKMEANGEDIDYKTLDVPINVRYSIGFSETSCIFAFAGPQVSFALGDNVLSFKDNDLGDVNWKLKDSAFSFNVGGGLLINHLQLSASYNVPIGNTSDFDWDDATEKVFHAHSKSKGWQIAAAYFF
ncbi:MAG: PorT family protein [Prevotella sp.]|nr:PorT family protein [Prevotella sp.]